MTTTKEKNICESSLLSRDLDEFKIGHMHHRYLMGVREKQDALPELVAYVGLPKCSEDGTEEIAKEQFEYFELEGLGAGDRLIWDRVNFLDDPAKDRFGLLTLIVGNVVFLLVFAQSLYNDERDNHTRHNGSSSATIDNRFQLQTYYVIDEDLSRQSPAIGPTGDKDSNSLGGNRKYWESIGAEQIGELLVRRFIHFDELVIWNELTLIQGNDEGVNSIDRFQCGNRWEPGEELESVVEFQRSHVVFRDPMRRLLGHIPIMCKPLYDNVDKFEKKCVFFKFNNLEGGEANQDKKYRCAVEDLYWYLIKDHEWNVARGAAMQRNLENLSAIQAPLGEKIVLIAGLPGTGKEAFAKSIHFSRVLIDQNEPTLFVVTTARDIEDTDGTAAKKLGEIINNKINKEKERRDIKSWKPSRISIFIDELNKAKDGDSLRADLLRVLEQPDETLPPDWGPKFTFILGASEHLDDLAREPPQDFWTRITHQLPVRHPLGHVTEMDATEFLSALFFVFWWGLVCGAVDNSPSGHRLAKGSKFSLFDIFAKEKNAESERAKKERVERERLAGQMFGKLLRWEESVHQKVDGVNLEGYRVVLLSDLCKLIIYEVLNTVVPLVIRDILPVRGMRSIVKQIFSRVMWQRYDQRTSPRPNSVREIGEIKAFFESSMDKRSEELEFWPDSESVRNTVNHAIQDVLAVLNAARHTEAKLAKSNKGGIAVERG